MVTRKDLTELIEVDLESPRLSIYLNFDSRKSSVAELVAGFHSLLHGEAFEGLFLEREKSKPAFKQVEKLLLSLRLPGGFYRGLAVFLANNGRYSKVFFLRESPQLLVVSKTFYLSPMIRDFFERQTFCFCLLDESRARLVVVSGDHVLDQLKLDSQTPNKVRAGGWYGLEEKKINRHIEEHIRHHFQKVFHSVEELFDRFKFDYLVLSLNSKHAEVFKKLLSKELTGRLIEARKLNINSSLETIKQKAMGLSQVKLEEGRARLLKELEEGLSRGRSVVGLEGFLRAWNEGLIAKGLIEKGYEISGFVCQNCRQYFIDKKSCPVCDSQTEEVSYLIDELIKKSVLSKTKFCWYDNFSPKIGAILRAYLF